MKTLYPNNKIQEALFKKAMALNNIISTDPDMKDPVCLPVLQGATPFFVDISRNFAWNPIVDYVGVSSYEGTSRQTINAYKMPKPDLIAGKAVMIFDDILDSGTTMDFLVKTCFSLGATAVMPVVLLKRSATPYVNDPRAKELLSVFEIGDEWVWGYGMDDEEGRCRAYKHIICK
jgi:hypoxanthine phosphoribosyltransferase